MSTHIDAEPGEIAPRVLLPGDPLRARWIAETFLDDPTCYSQIRGTFGFTGTFRGERISVQATGMGMPSTSISVNELIDSYDVQQLVRVGSCGALSESLQLRDIVIAQAAATDSSMNTLRFGGCHFPPTADFGLLRAAVDAAEARRVRHVVGTIFSSDSFYHPRPERIDEFAQYGALAIEMEAAEIYTLAALRGRQALAICTVSDVIATGEMTSAHEREQTFIEMVEIALDAALATPLG